MIFDDSNQVGINGKAIIQWERTGNYGLNAKIIIQQEKAEEATPIDEVEKKNQGNNEDAENLGNTTTHERSRTC